MSSESPLAADVYLLDSNLLLLTLALGFEWVLHVGACRDVLIVSMLFICPY